MGGSDSSSSSSSPKEEVRNWVEMPSEIMFLIFTKVGAIDILLKAQFVCATWRKFCKEEPHLFQSIDIKFCYRSNIDKEMYLVKEVVNRSCGQLVDFSIQDFAKDEVLEHIIANECPLRRLRFESCYWISDSAAIDAAKKLPLLEELEISNGHFHNLVKVIEAFGRCCPLLKSFRLNYMIIKACLKASDKGALAIAQSMPELRHLDLTGAHLTNNGLKAILDGCPHLKFLDLSRCPHLNYAGSGGLVKMCVDRNIELRSSGKAALVLELITRVQRRFTPFLLLQNEIPEYEGIEAGYDEEFDVASSLYSKALHQTLAQIQSQYNTLSQMQSKILSHLNK